MPLRSGGLISGLDTNTLVAQLVELERAPIKKLESKKSAYNAQLSLIGGIKSALTDLRTKMKELDSARELIAMAAVSSNDTAFTADATGDAAAASYAVEVLQAARAEKNRTSAFAGAASQVRAGTLTITVKGAAAQQVAIVEGDTLKDVVARINDQVNGATASLISDGTSWYLSLTADETGHTVGGPPSDALVISESYTGVTGQQLGLVEITAAQNAQLTLDGLSIESDSNDVRNALSGVTIHVHKATSGPETLDVAADKAELEARLQELVDAYNKVVELVARETKVTAQTDRTKTLAGDPSIRALQAALSGAATFSVPSLAGTGYDALSTFGIKTDSSGKLTLDSEDLQAALDDNLQSVSRVLTASDGVAARMLGTIESYVSVDGVLQARSDGINRSVRQIDTRIYEMELRVQSFEDNLVRQFTALESTVSALQSQGNFLASSL